MTIQTSSLLILVLDFCFVVVVQKKGKLSFFPLPGDFQYSESKFNI